VGEKLQDRVVQWLGLATIEQAQGGGGMVYVRGHCS